MAKTALEQWDETAANNTDRGGVSIAEGCNPSDVNNAMRELMSQVAKWLGDDTLASATTTDLVSVPGRYVSITGTTTITGLGTIKAGTIKFVKFAGALILTHNGTSLILPGAANITTAAGDTAIFVSEGSGNWRCFNYSRAFSFPPFTQEYVSAQQSFVTGGVVVLSHGLGVIPKLVMAEVVCLTGEGGYSTGAVVEIATTQQSTSIADNYGASFVKTSTNVQVVFGSGGTFVIMNASTFTGIALTPANWRLVVRAWA